MAALVEDNSFADWAMDRSTAHLRAILDAITDGYCMLDRQWRFTAVSPGAARHFGRAAEDLVGLNVWEETGLGLGTTFYDSFHEAVALQSIVRFETESRLHPGEWYELTLLPQDEALDVFFTRITDRKVAQSEALEAAEERALALEIANLGTWVFDEAEKIVRLDARSAQVLGLSDETELLLPDFFSLIVPEDRERVRNDVTRALAPDGPGEYSSEHRVRHPDGTIRWVVGRGRPLRRGSRGGRGSRRFFGTLMDVSERRHAEESLRDTSERLRQQADDLQAVLDALPAAVFITRDPLARQMEGNRFAEEMLRLPRGANLSKSAPAEEQPTTFRVMREGVEIPPADLPVQRALRLGQEVRDYEFDMAYEDGTKTRLLGNAAPLRDGHGRVRGAVGAFVDITRLKQVEEALNHANGQLAEADRRKDEFIAILSHELRNPLAPIRYALPILEREALGPSAVTAMQVIDRQVDHLTRLVDDLLDVSRITGGKIELRREQVALASVLQAAVEAASPGLSAARHAFELTVPDEEIWLHADAARIAQVITNLLNNAAKFTPRGGRVALEARVEGGLVQVCVRDNGIGIPRHALSSVFDMFRQVDRPGRTQGGLGIGLALVKRLVEMHDGSVEARSEGEGKGSEFLVRLPVAPRPASSPQPPVRMPDSVGRRLKVLVVDDNVDLVEMLAILVQAAGHEVRKALDGQSAVSAAAAYRPDLVLLDLGLPVMSGFDVARALRRNPELATVKLVALTGWGQPEDRRQTEEAGFDDHLTKPADADRLAQILAHFAAE